MIPNIKLSVEQIRTSEQMTSQFSRRHFTKTAMSAAGILLAHGCTRSLAKNSHISPLHLSNAPEVTTVRIGFLPLLDAAPLIIAKEKGLFNNYGMTGVELVQYDDWQTLQSALVLGPLGLAGAHIPSPLPYLIMAGKTANGELARTYILARLNVNGQSISLANIYKELDLHLDSSTLKESVERAKAGGPGMKLKMAIPCVGGTHDLWLRYWLAAGDINPDTDVMIVVVPPAQMVANMQTGTVHAFCVDDPFALQLVKTRSGFSALTTGELWADHPEKAFVMQADWVNHYPKATQALLMAVQEAQIWCDLEANWAEMVATLVDGHYLQSSQSELIDRLRGNFNLGDDRWFKNRSNRIKFWQDQASYPYKSHDTWFVTECIRWGYLPPNIDIQGVVNAVNREDLWRQAARAIGQTSVILKEPQSRGIETFFDNQQFDPHAPLAYLNRQPIRKRA